MILIIFSFGLYFVVVVNCDFFLVTVATATATEKITVKVAVTATS